MKLNIAFALTLAILEATAYNAAGSPGCHIRWAQTTGYVPSEVLKIGTSKNGVREYILDLPRAWKTGQPMPLIVAFHGKYQKNVQFREQTQFSNPELNDKAIVAYPQAIDEQWSGDPTSPPLSHVNDVEFAESLIDHIAQLYCIDTRRIYAVGFSNGGGLTQLLACDPKASKKLAAAAIVSGAFYYDHALKDPLFSQCHPAHTPLPVMEFHGVEDPVIHYNGRGTPDGQTYEIANWGREWAERNGCSPGHESKDSWPFGNLIERKTWKCGSSKETVVHYRIPEFGHGWPSIKKQDDDFQRYGPAAFNATPIILDFFKEHALPESSKAFKDEL